MEYLFLFALYFLPTIIAACNHHRSAAAIFLVNLFLGWTGFGWLVTLIWSIVSPAPAAPPVVIYNNSGSGIQHTHEVGPWEPYRVQAPSPVRQLADRAAERLHEAIVPPVAPIKEAKVFSGINFETVAEWERMSADEKTCWGNSFEKYYRYKNG